MKPIIDVANWASELVMTIWTPIFIVLFVAVLVYALRPSKRSAFDEAAKMPLRED